MSALAIALGATALVAGVTCTWSPCGFSVIETLGPGAWGARRATTAVAWGAFAAGCLVGGVLTFGALSLLGAGLSTAGSGIAVAAAVAIATLAALGEVGGVRIVPQIRRQVPERWRRELPLPVAGGLYGVLLGLGFTTFVLTLAVYALAGLAVALGDPSLGLVIGLCFGAGRALPVLVLAPLGDTALGARALELMAERPATLRGFRWADAAALAACAVLLSAGDARAATVVTGNGTDPSVFGDALAWQQPGATGVLRVGAVVKPLTGTDPAVGGGLLAVRSGNAVAVVRLADGAPVANVTIAGVDKLAVSARWLVYRRRTTTGDVIGARELPNVATERVVARLAGATPLGRPSVWGDLVVFHVAGDGGSKIVQYDLRSRRSHVLRRSSTIEYLNPTRLGRSLLYVRISRCAQQLRLARRGRDRLLLRQAPIAGSDTGHDPGHTGQGSESSPGCPQHRRSASQLWTTGLSARFAYVTRIRPGGGRPAAAAIVRVHR